MIDGIGSSSGRLTLSSIEFHIDLGTKGGRVIPLGYIAEITVGTMCGLGMIARTELTAEEREQIGELGRQLLENPYDYLSGQFDEAWDHADPGERLEYLASQHGHSLHFAIPKESAVPKRLLLGSAPIRSEVRNHLLGALEEKSLESFGMNAPAGPLPQNELWELAAAA